MRSNVRKLFLGISCLTMLFGLASCGAGGYKNNRVYTMSEIEGRYKYSTYSNGTNYDYILVIEGGYAKVTKESYTFESVRYGMPHNKSDLLSGSVVLTESNIKIGSYTGYIKTEYTITITINDITYKKQ